MASRSSTDGKTDSPSMRLRPSPISAKVKISRLGCSGVAFVLERLHQAARRRDLVERPVECPLAAEAGDDVAPAAAGSGVPGAHRQLRTARSDPLLHERCVRVGLEHPGRRCLELARERDGLLPGIDRDCPLVGHVEPFVLSSSWSSRSYFASRRRRCASSHCAVRSMAAGSRWTGRGLPLLPPRYDAGGLEHLDVLRYRLERDRELACELVHGRVAADEPIDDRSSSRIAERLKGRHQPCLDIQPIGERRRRDAAATPVAGDHRSGHDASGASGIRAAADRTIVMGRPHSRREA